MYLSCIYISFSKREQILRIEKKNLDLYLYLIYNYVLVSSMRHYEIIYLEKKRVLFVRTIYNYYTDWKTCIFDLFLQDWKNMYNNYIEKKQTFLSEVLLLSTIKLLFSFFVIFHCSMIIYFVQEQTYVQ